MADAVTTETGTATTDTGTSTTAATTTEATTPVVPATTAATETTPTTAATAPTLVVPEKYELKLADGLKVDPAIVEKTAATARTLGLSNDKAQELLNFTASEIAAREAAQETENKPGGTAYTARVQGWEQAALADPEIGGSVAKLQENVTQAKKVLGTFGDESIATFLNETGFGSHPSVIRMLAKLGKAMGEGTLVTGSAPNAKQLQDPAERLYGAGTSKTTTSE